MAGRKPKTDEELLAGMAAYIRQHAILPTSAEYQATRGDLPDESTIRTRLGGWMTAWRRALALALRGSGRGRGNADAKKDRAVIALYAQGLSLRAIGEQLGVTGGAVGQRIKRLRREGLLEARDPQPQRRPLSPQDIRIMELYQQDRPLREIAALVGLQTPALKTRLARLRKGGHLSYRGLRGEWQQAQDTGWPLSPARLAVHLYGEDAAEKRRRAFIRLYRWEKQGLVVRIARGIYDLQRPQQEGK